MAYRITEDCISCSACEVECPQGAIRQGAKYFVIDPKKCTACASCAGVCPVDACVPR